ncbi:hypothetical protein KR018_009784 [Drosophila ironensis]|nr:hypothetical protein KR018_009784 [Drosophila ironensis]
MRCKVLVFCVIICLLVVLAECRQRQRTRSNSLAAREGNRNVVRRNLGHRANARRANTVAAKAKNARRSRLNAATKANKRRNLAKKDKTKANKAASTSTRSSYVEIGLNFRQNFVRTTDNLRSERSFLNARYGTSFAKTYGAARLSNIGNMEYDCKMSLGTPKQVFTVLPDTGSSNVWVPGPNCKSKACREHTRFYPKKSSTFKANGKAFQITYGSGSVTGKLVKDVARVAGLVAENMTFAITTTEPGTAFLKSGFDGILGLGYQSISVDNVLPFILRLCKEDVIDDCAFAICMRGGGTSKRGGSLIIGRTNTTDYTGSNSYTYTPVTKKGYWQIQIGGVYIGGTKLPGSTKAIVDSGTSMIAAPLAAYKKMIEITGCTPTSSGVCWLKCSTAVPDFEFAIGGKKFVVKGKKMMMKVETSKGKTVCIMALQYMDIDYWILGDAFMRRHCVVFDFTNNRVGIASSTE